MNPSTTAPAELDRLPPKLSNGRRKPAKDSERNFGLQSEADLVLARFRLRARLRTAWLQKLWNEEGVSGGNLAVTHAEIATHLLDRDSPAAEAEWIQSNPQTLAWREELTRVENALSCVAHSRLLLLQQMFGLNVEASNLLQACIAVALDPSLTRVCAYLNDHAGRPFLTEALAARLFGYGRCGVWSINSPLFSWEFILVRENAPGEPRALLCDPQIMRLVSGPPGARPNPYRRCAIPSAAPAPGFMGYTRDGRISTACSNDSPAYSGTNNHPRASRQRTQGLCCCALC